MKHSMIVNTGHEWECVAHGTYGKIYKDLRKPFMSLITLFTLLSDESDRLCEVKLKKIH